jgi:hypothetical protein
MADTADITASILARYRRNADMADTADILVRYRREADTSSAEAARNSVAAHRKHIEVGVAANGAAVNGAAISGAAANGAAETGAAVTGIGTALRAGAFLTRLTTDIILMGITLRIRTDLVIPTTGVGTPLGTGAILTRTCPTTFILTGTILRIGTLMTTAPYQEGDSFDPPLGEARRLMRGLTPSENG